MNFYVYVHKLNSGPNSGQIFYVGKGSGRRAWNISTRNRYWKSLVNKYGVSVNIVDSDIPEEQAFELEKFLIETIGRDRLCNFTDGGEGMSNPAEHVRLKLSQSHIGKRHTDEQKKKISISGRGRKLSDFHREVLRLSRIGVKISEETRHKIALSRIGIKVSNETRAKRGMAVICSNGMQFASMGLAVDWLIAEGKTKAQKTPISKVCEGQRKTAYGFSWRFFNK